MEQSTLFFICGIGFIVLLVIVYFFYRFVFSIKRQLWNQKQIIKLLAMIAEQNGGNTTEISEILDKLNRQDQYLGK